MWYGALAVALATLIIVTAVEWRRARRLFRQTQRLSEQWRLTDPAARLHLFRDALHTAAPPPAAWYLAGWAHLRADSPEAAARLFGMAAHGDADLPSAALLTFALLKQAADDQPPDAPLLRQFVTTWEEMRRPRLGRSRNETLIWAALAERCAPPPGLSDLGRLAWLAADPAERIILLSPPDSAPRWTRPLFHTPPTH